MSDKLHIVPPTHPAFTKQIEQFEFDGKTDPKELSQKMIEMMQKAGAAGLAANQLGLEHRVFVLNTKPDAIACFNPKIVHYSDKYAVNEEGCLTFPGLYVKIRRPAWIRVRYQEADGSIKTTTLNGLAARAFQHELDHLDGINYMTRAKKIHMDQAKRKQKLIERKLKRMQLA